MQTGFIVRLAKYEVRLCEIYRVHEKGLREMKRERDRARNRESEPPKIEATALDAD